MSPKEIMGIQNLELRRAIIEKVGYAHFEKNASVISITNKGTSKERILLIVNVPNDENIVFIKVLDGTIKGDIRNTYYIRVPPNMKNADEAVAWTFGMSKNEYQPSEET